MGSEDTALIIVGLAELLKTLISATIQAQTVANLTDEQVNALFEEERARMLANDPTLIPDPE